MQAGTKGKAAAGNSKKPRAKSAKPAGPPPVPKPWEGLSEGAMRQELEKARAVTAQRELDKQPAEKEYYRSSYDNLHLHRDKAWLAREAQFVKHSASEG